MDKSDALAAFAALSQPARLDAFRLLIKAGPDGLPAGQIAIALDQRQNTMSANLSILAQAGLITATRQGRSILYSAHMPALRGLLSFLMEDCCGGAPEACEPLLDTLTCPC